MVSLSRWQENSVCLSASSAKRSHGVWGWPQKYSLFSFLWVGNGRLQALSTKLNHGVCGLVIGKQRIALYILREAEPRGLGLAPEIYSLLSAWVGNTRLHAFAATRRHSVWGWY
jgi:hypothetical protein